jgi:hypothetical protein
MNKYCYADFVSWFEPVFLSKKGKQMRNVDSELPENDYSLDPIDEEDGESENFDAFSDSVFELKDGTVLRKRKKLKVLRYHKASLNDDTEEYYRHILMLFTAWRNEDVDLLKGCKTYEESYFKQKDVVEFTRSRYKRIQSGIDQDSMIDEEHLENYNINNIVPEVLHSEPIKIRHLYMLGTNIIHFIINVRRRLF